MLGKGKKRNNKCGMCHADIATHVGPWGPGKCTVHGVVGTAAVQATMPIYPQLSAATDIHQEHNVPSPPLGVHVTPVSPNTRWGASYICIQPIG